MLDERSEKKLIGVHPELVHLCYMMDQAGHKFYVTQGVRTQREQEALYAQGRTKPGPIVTHTMNSKHLRQPDGFGHAIDFAPRAGKGIDWNDTTAFEVMGKDFEDMAASLGIRIVWGGRFSGKCLDKPHLELR